MSNQVETPWKGVCSKRCYFARHDPCKCKCHGQNHQKGLLKVPETEEEFKTLANLKTRKPEVAEKIFNMLQVALTKRPDWKKYVEEKITVDRV